MGQTQSKIIKKEPLRSSHPALNNAKVINQLDKRYIEATFLTQNQAYDSWIQEMQKGKTRLVSDYLFLPIATHYDHNEGLCGNGGSLKVKYPYYPHLLSQLIRAKAQTKTYFLEGQLWYILYSLTLALHQIKSYSPKIGDIKPQNIFIDENGKIKVANIYSWPDEFPSFLKANDLANVMFNGLLAPEDMQQLQRGSLNNDQNQFSQIFAIGATIISAGSLLKFSEVYNYQNKTFNMVIFKDKRKQWAQNEHYTDFFKCVILNLIEKNPGMRLTSSQLFEFISPYSQYIINKKKFTIQKAPQKLQISFSALRSKNY